MAIDELDCNTAQLFEADAGLLAPSDDAVDVNCSPSGSYHSSVGLVFCQDRTRQAWAAHVSGIEPLMLSMRCPSDGRLSAWSSRTEDATSQDELSSDAARAQVLAHFQLQRIRDEIQDAIEIAREDGEQAITDEARATCLRIARFVLPKLIGRRGVRVAAFDEGQGHAALIVHSLEQRRRLSLEVSADGSRFVERKTDEQLATVTRSIRADYVEATLDSIHWLTGEAE